MIGKKEQISSRRSCLAKPGGVLVCCQMATCCVGRAFIKSRSAQFTYANKYLELFYESLNNRKMYMRRYIVRLLVATTAAFVTTLPANAKPNPEIYAVEDGIRVSTNISQKIDIAEMSVHVQLHGRMVETVMEVTLKNPGDEEIEANFALALPADAVVTGYALDINNVMIEGVLVDQPKAKAVYEDEIREGIDPGLAEVTSGNIFRTRVYPINGDGQRKISIRFVAPADPTKGFVLPFESDGPVGSFTLAVEAEGFRTAPIVKVPFEAKLALSRNNGRWSGNVIAPKNTKLAGEIGISGGEPVNEMLVSQHDNGRAFFQIAASEPGRDTKAATIERVRVYWDSSLSRRDDLLDTEAMLISEIAAKSGGPTVDLVKFSSAAPEIASGMSSTAVSDVLKATVYRGGTSFRGLDDLKLADADLCLLFSDGSPTIETDAEFKPDCRLMVISSAPDSNSLRLGMMARQSKGQLLRLTSGNVAQITAQILKPAVAVVAARDDDGRKLPFRTLAAPDGGWFVVGRAPDNGDVHLTITGLRKGSIKRSYTQDSNAFSKNNGAGVLWAAEELERLADNPLKRDAMRDVAESYQVASPTMSLLVLERPDQYLRAEIKPPKGFDDEWMADYRERKTDRDKQQNELKSERLSDVRTKWTERVKWWNTSFKAPKKVKPKREKLELLEAPAADAAAPAYVVPPSPNVASNSVQSEPQEIAGNDDGYIDMRDVGEGDEEIVVTSTRMSNETLQDVALAITTIDGDGNPVKMEIADVLSDQPYLEALDEATPDQRLSVLAEQEKTYGALPAFYLDTAEWFRLKGDKALSEALLLSALELPVADDETRLIAAFRLQRAGEFDEAVRMLELLEVRTENRPQPRRSLALALIARGKARGAAGLSDLERAFKLLTSVALDPGKDGYSGGNYEGIEIVALMEANAIIPLIEQYGGSWELDSKLTAMLDTDVRIVIEWTNDDADIDLWVIEPTGEKTFYGNKLSKAGGTITNDMTDGYGPEEYAMRRAIPGEYVVKIDGYSPDRLNPNGKGRVMVRLIRDFGRKTESEELVDAELSFDSEDGERAKLVAKLKVDKAKK